MAGKRNRLGRVYEPGKALSEPLREEIIEMYHEGLSLTEISNDVKVTVRGVKAEIHDATNRCDTSRRQALSSALILLQVAAIRHLFGARNRFWKRGNVN